MTTAFKNCQVFLTIVIIILMGEISFGQKNDDNQTTNARSEGFLKLPDGVIKNEIASFIVKALGSQERLPKVRLNEIPLKKCSNSFVFFEKSNLYASEMIVSIES